MKVFAGAAVLVFAVFGALAWELVRQPDATPRETPQQYQQVLDKAEQARKAAEAEASQLRDAVNEAKRARELAETEAKRQREAANEAKRNS